MSPPLDLDTDLALQSMGARQGDPNLATLLAAPGAAVIYNADYGYTKDVSNKVSNLVAQVGPYSVASTLALRPTWGVLSPLARRGLTFNGSNRLVDPASALAQLLDGTQQLSWLVVATSGNATNRAVWGIGNSATANEYHYSGPQVSHTTRFARASAGVALSLAGSVSSGLGAIYCETGTMTTNAALFNGWMNGAPELVNAAGLINKAPVCDTFSLGAVNIAGSYALVPFNGDLYFLIIATAVWSTAQRQALEAAARAYFIA